MFISDCSKWLSKILKNNKKIIRTCQSHKSWHFNKNPTKISHLLIEFQSTGHRNLTSNRHSPLKAVSVHNTKRRSLRKRAGCSNHASKLQRKLSTTPSSTKLGSSQNKLGMKHKCPDLELDMAKVFVLEGEKKSEPEPSSKAVL